MKTPTPVVTGFPKRLQGPRIRAPTNEFSGRLLLRSLFSCAQIATVCSTASMSSVFRVLRSSRRAWVRCSIAAEFSSFFYAVAFQVCQSQRGLRRERIDQAVFWHEGGIPSKSFTSELHPHHVCD